VGGVLLVRPPPIGEGENQKKTRFFFFFFFFCPCSCIFEKKKKIPRKCIQSKARGRGQTRSLPPRKRGFSKILSKQGRLQRGPGARLGAPRCRGSAWNCLARSMSSTIGTGTKISTGRSGPRAAAATPAPPLNHRRRHRSPWTCPLRDQTRSRRAESVRGPGTCRGRQPPSNNRRNGHWNLSDHCRVPRAHHSPIAAMRALKS
jgi:hypothetical protein